MITWGIRYPLKVDPNNVYAVHNPDTGRIQPTVFHYNNTIESVCTSIKNMLFTIVFCCYVYTCITTVIGKVCSKRVCLKFVYAHNTFPVRYMLLVLNTNKQNKKQ